MPIGWVLSCPLPSQIGVRASTFNCNIEYVALDDKKNNWFKLEPYGVFKQDDLRSVADQRSRKTVQSTRFHNSSRYTVGLL